MVLVVDPLASYNSFKFK